MTSFAKSLEPSSRAAARTGPKQPTEAARRASTAPATSGASGPTTTRSTPASTAAPASASGSAASRSSGSGSARIPALPGAHNNSGRWGERASARTSACSRPPEPTTRTLMGPKGLRSAGSNSERGDEVVDRDGGQRLEVRRAARAQLQGDASHRLLVRRLDDVHEVEVPERGPLRLDGRAELLDLVVDLADAGGVVADGLHALGSEGGEHDPGRHGSSSVGSPGVVPDPFGTRAVLSVLDGYFPHAHAPRRAPRARPRRRAACAAGGRRRGDARPAEAVLRLRHLD